MRTPNEGSKGRKPKPRPKPKPPPVPHSKWTDPPWKGKVIYFAWGLETGQFTPDSLADLAARCGARAAAVQVTPGNLGLHAQVKAKLHARGIAYLIWERSDQKTTAEILLQLMGLVPDGYLADVEGPMREQVARVIAATYPDLPRSLCATGALDLGGVDPASASKPWIDNGWDLAMQDYYFVNPNASPEGEENWAYWRGWPLNAIGKYHWPVLEVNAEGSGPFAVQVASVDAYRDEKGRLCVGIYLAEELTDEDIAAIKAA